jgi:hypothetical protein
MTIPRSEWNRDYPEKPKGQSRGSCHFKSYHKLIIAALFILLVASLVTQFIMLRENQMQYEDLQAKYNELQQYTIKANSLIAAQYGTALGGIQESVAGFEAQNLHQASLLTDMVDNTHEQLRTMINKLTK